MRIKNQIIFYMMDVSEENGRCYAFIINLNKELEHLEMVNREDYDIALYDLENSYGIHDWGTSPSPEIDAIGYHSYEVESNEKFEELLSEWQKVFSKMNIVDSVSKLVSWRGELPDETDFVIYQKTLELLK